MKKLFAVLSVAAFASVASLQAQSNVLSSNSLPATLESQQSFVQSFVQYFSSFNTNSSTFGTNAQYDVWVGAAYQSGINLGAQLAFEAKPFAAVPGLQLSEVSTFANVIGTVAQEEFDLGYAIDHYDTELSFGLGGVDTFQASSEADKGFHCGIYAEVKKALTANSFAGTRLEGLVGSGHGNELVVSLFAGFTF